MTDPLADVGALRHRVAWEAPDPAADGQGDDEDNYQPLGTFWARVVPLSGRELEVARRQFGVVSHRVRMRQVRPKQGACPIGPTHRLVFRGRPLNVTAAVRVDEADTWLDVYCTEEPPQ